MSFDSPAENDSWGDTQGYEYELWSDNDRELALYYGAATSAAQGAAARVTKILDEDGVLVLEYTAGISTGTHPQLVLNDVTQLFGP